MFNFIFPIYFTDFTRSKHGYLLGFAICCNDVTCLIRKLLISFVVIPSKLKFWYHVNDVRVL